MMYDNNTSCNCFSSISIFEPIARMVTNWMKPKESYNMFTLVVVWGIGWAIGHMICMAWAK
jgi:hypothetical protein